VFAATIATLPSINRLPDNIKSVLVRDSGVSQIRSTALYMDGKFYPDFNVLEHCEVTHWRPIDLK
jgi:hypothetical protein